MIEPFEVVLMGMVLLPFAIAAFAVAMYKRRNHR